MVQDTSKWQGEFPWLKASVHGAPSALPAYTAYLPLGALQLTQREALWCCGSEVD